MALTSTDIQNQSFSIDRKGYDVDEVDVFLEHVSHELDDMNALIEQLQSDGGRFDGFDTPAPEPVVDTTAIEERDARIAELQRQLQEKEADGNAIAQALIIAQRSADEIVANANADAERTRQDAEEEAARILEKANGEKQKVLDAIKKLEEDREDARGEYQELLGDFIESASKKLAEISDGVVPAATQAKHTSSTRTRSSNQAPIRSGSAATGASSVSAATAAYTTPQTSPVVVTPTTPTPSKVEKDFSGFGDADDTFEFEEID